jgi:hypothetical protein
MMPYTPSRLDWLAVDLEASYRSEMKTTDSTAVSYLPQAPDTIIILVQYTDRTSAGLVDSSAEVGKIFVNREATRLGWSQMGEN